MCNGTRSITRPVVQWNKTYSTKMHGLIPFVKILIVAHVTQIFVTRPMELNSNAQFVRNKIAGCN